MRITITHCRIAVLALLLASGCSKRSTESSAADSDRNSSPVASKKPTVTSSLDPKLVGCWEVQSVEMPQGRTLGLIQGSPGQRVCFSEGGNYNIFPHNDDTTRYRCVVARPYCELDIWIRGLEPLTSLCLYAIDGDVLKITVAGRPLGSKQAITRPTAMQMDEQRNWVLITMKRSDSPKK